MRKFFERYGVTALLFGLSVSVAGNIFLGSTLYDYRVAVKSMQELQAVQSAQREEMSKLNSTLLSNGARTLKNDE